MTDPSLWCPKRQIYTRGNSSNREQWLAARQLHITASDVASAAGVGMRKRSEVMKEKLGLLTDNDKKREQDMHQMAQVAAGRYFEPGIIKWFADEHLGATEECGDLLFRTGEHEFIAATPDAIHCIDGSQDAKEGEPLEVKNVGAEGQYNWAQNTTSREGWPKQLPFPLPSDAQCTWALSTNKVAAKWEGTPTGAWREHFVKLRTDILPLIGAPCAPLKYVVQLYMQMYVLKRTEGIICACIGGQNRMDLYYTLHEPTLEYLLDTAKDFWNDLRERQL